MTISDEEKNILIPEIRNLISNPGIDLKTANEFRVLESSVSNGAMEEDILTVFSHVLEILLTTGEIRKKYGYQEELLILRLYKNTPWGNEREDNLNMINRTLSAIQKHKINNMSFRLKLPGVYGLEITTDKCQLVIEIDQFGISPGKVELEL